jgi:hypothetical protein
VNTMSAVAAEDFGQSAEQSVEISLTIPENMESLQNSAEEGSVPELAPNFLENSPGSRWISLNANRRELLVEPRIFLGKIKQEILSGELPVLLQIPL